MANTTNKDLGQQIEHLSDKLDRFILQYHEDMHGDSMFNNGERGIIGNIRWLKDQWVENPPLLKLFKNNPVKWTSTIIITFLTAFVLLHTIVSIPQIDSMLMAFLKIPVP